MPVTEKDQAEQFIAHWPLLRFLAGGVGGLVFAAKIVIHGYRWFLGEWAKMLNARFEQHEREEEIRTTATNQAVADLRDAVASLTADIRQIHNKLMTRGDP